VRPTLVCRKSCRTYLPEITSATTRSGRPSQVWL